ncbi:MAG: hypothetical protein JNM63_03065, partial [Spirochaetia bacterium]|nr:hypothetical protein [Spirochaetia bacterium]
LRERLRQAVSQIPFAFPPALEILEEDDFFLSRLLEGFARRFDLSEEALSGAAFVFELVRTTLTVHARVSRESSAGQEKFFENDKLAILAGDDLFTRALAEIPKIGNPALEANIHLSITDACRSHLLHSLGDGSEAGPILAGVLMAPALLRNGELRPNSADFLTMREVAAAFGAKNSFEMEKGEWLTPFFSKNISPFAKQILEVFKKEALQGTPQE